ncbi:helix-turn-helix transcriptional regulator [Bdellovibrio sp. HCB290]|uniref:helix-turn-helix transcriptional regulator n=1 Tax=Bdellovibrio sp. HCB290 TaxID=3394356 RepID=UPI0039B45904
MNHQKAFKNQLNGRPQPLLSEPHQVFDIIKVNFLIKQDNSRECIDLYRKGLSLRDIGKELNISKTTVRSHLVKAGVELSPKDPIPTEVSRWRTRKTKTPPPFGYCYFQGRLVENPIEYDVLLKIHRQWKEGRDANEITHYLKTKRFRPRKAKAWHNKAVKKIVARFESKQIVIKGEEL